MRASSILSVRFESDRSNFRISHRKLARKGDAEPAGYYLGPTLDQRPHCRRQLARPSSTDRPIR